MMILKGPRNFLFLLLLVGCGTLIGNPEDEDDTASAPGELGEQVFEDQNNPTEVPGVLQEANGQGPSPDSAGRVNLYLADAPIDDMSSVIVNVTGFSVLAEGGSWLSYQLPEIAVVDLLQYQGGDTFPLAAIDLGPGIYSELRLILDETEPAKVVLKDGVEHALAVPSGDESGLKIKAEINVSVGGNLSIVMDFDLRRSLTETGDGGYKFKPVIKVANQENTGTINVVGSQATSACVYSDAAVEAADGSDCANALASGLVREDDDSEGDDDEGDDPTGDGKDFDLHGSGGSIRIAFLDPGTYRLVLFNGDAKVKVVEDVEVVAGRTTTIKRK